jgi:uncharacterized protein (DUF302 family)
VIRRQSESGYLETVASLVAAIERRSLTLFARIDHAAGARDVGMELADEQVLVFGNARSGTPLMQSDPHVGLDLPLRILISRESDGVWIGYHDPRELSEAYDIRRHQPTLEQMAGLLSDLAGDAAAGPGRAEAGGPGNHAR